MNQPTIVFQLTIRITISTGTLLWLLALIVR